MNTIVLMSVFQIIIILIVSQNYEQVCYCIFFYSGYHYKNKNGGGFSPRYANAVKAKADATDLDKIQEKDKTKCIICNTDIIDDFNIYYDHYIIRHSDL